MALAQLPTATPMNMEYILLKVGSFLNNCEQLWNRIWLVQGRR